MAVVFIGIGSNLGDRRRNCSKAVELMVSTGISVIRTSSHYETDPWGMKDQPRFINMALEGCTVLSPHNLLQLLKDIERSMGRKQTAGWGPRIIDLDILFYNDMIFSSDDLIIPHPFLHERLFVLEPLAEISPNKTHPVLKKTVQALLEDLRTNRDGNGKIL